MTGDPYLRAEVATDVRRRLAGVHGTGHDEHRMVSAVVSGTGALVDLRFHPAAPAIGPIRLGEAIVAAAAAAQADAAGRGYTMLALALGDEATATVEASAAGTPPPARSPAPRRDRDFDGAGGARDEAGELDSFDASVLRSDR